MSVLAPLTETRPHAYSNRSTMRDAVFVCLVVTDVYALAGYVGMWLRSGGAGVSIFWPAAGVGLAAVLRYGWRAILGIALGAMIVNLATGNSLLSAVGIMIGNVAGTALGGWLATHRGKLTLDRVSGVGLLVVAAGLGSVPAAVIGTLVVWLHNALPSGPLMGAVVWWTGDVSGVLLVAPVLLWPVLATQAKNRAGIAWAALLVSVFFAVGFALTPRVPRTASLTACLPIMVIAAVRYGPRGAALANLLPAIVILSLVADSRLMDQRLALIGFLSVAAVTSLCLGTVTAERDAAEAALTADIAARVAAEDQKAIAESALAADRVKFATLLAHSHDAIAVMTPDGHTAFVSDAITRLTGRTPAELIGRMTIENVHPDDVALVNLTFADTLAHPGLPTKVEFRVRTTDGRWVWLEALATNHVCHAIGGVVVNIRDVTERREAENRLREVRTLLEATGNLARIGGWEFLIAEDRLVWSQQIYQIHEVSPGEFTPTVAAVLDFYAPEARPKIREARERALTTGEPWNLVLPFTTARGRRLWVNVIGQVETRGGKPHRLYGTFQDVTERVEAEHAVEHSEARYRNLFEAAPVAIWEEDLSGIAAWFARLRTAGVSDLAAHLATNPALAVEASRMIRARSVNQAAVAMIRARDKADLLANLPKLFGPETDSAFIPKLVGLWNGERALQLPTRATRVTGEPTDIVLHVGVPDAGGHPDFSRVIVLAVDVTEQKRLEEQFRQAHKMEAVGRLAGGLAHDFNNLLTVINGFSELVAAEAAAGSTIRNLIAHIQDAGGRGAVLTKQLLAFSRQQSPMAGPVDVSGVVEGLRMLLAPLIGDSVRLETRLVTVPPVLADRAQIESVIMNLCANARDAMPDGGTVTIETAFVATTDPSGPDELPAGQWVMLSVADTGTGIPEAVRPHLFEPFFTTKEIGKGTGLGLSTVYGIATTARGHVRYTTTMGRGTTFRVYLPATGSLDGYAMPSVLDGGLSTSATSESLAIPPEAAVWGIGSDPAKPAPLILLVEDQDAIRELSARVLEETGFEVIRAADGSEALDRLAGLTRPLTLLVSDVRMPRMNGRELADCVRAMFPDVRVLFVSGYSEDVVASHEAFLPKPFSVDELTDAVIALLGPRTHPDG